MEISGDINDVAITSSTSGDITTAQDTNDTTSPASSVSNLTGPVLLGANITIDTDSSGNNGDVTMTSTVMSSTAGARTLTIKSGSGPVKIYDIENY